MRGTERVFEVTLNDPDMVWDDDKELYDLNLVSTSSLLDLIHSLSYKLITTQPEETSVVISSNARYISPVIMGQPIRVRLFVANQTERNVLIKAEILDSAGEKCFEAEIVRRIVEKDWIRRLAVEKAAKI